MVILKITVEQLSVKCTAAAAACMGLYVYRTAHVSSFY